MSRTYNDFVSKYGKRPPDIVFAVTQLDTLEAERERILCDLRAIYKESSDLIDFERKVFDYILELKRLMRGEMPEG